MRLFTRTPRHTPAELQAERLAILAQTERMTALARRERGTSTLTLQGA